MIDHILNALILAVCGMAGVMFEITGKKLDMISLRIFGWAMISTGLYAGYLLVR